MSVPTPVPPTSIKGGAERAWLRAHPPTAVLGLDVPVESQCTFSRPEGCVLADADEGDEVLVAPTPAVVDEECASADRLDTSIVARSISTRNGTSVLTPLSRAGVALDPDPAPDPAPAVVLNPGKLGIPTAFGEVPWP